MWLLAGLGNPGGEYENNRHNIGFMAVDLIADKYGFPAYKTKFQGLMSEGTLGEKKVLLIKPQTFMNNSGQSVAAAAKFYKIPPERVVIIHDEIDLEPAKVKVKQGGGAAGHNGIKSVQAHLGTPDFWRVRLGVGHPGERAKVHNHVLDDFSKVERKWLELLLAVVADHAPMIVDGDAAGFMREIAEEQQKASN